MIITYKYRIKDSNSRKKLCELASKVNFVWNYVNEIYKKSYRNFLNGFDSQIMSAFDLHHLLSGSSKELGLGAQSIQAIAEHYAQSCKTHAKSYLSWRSSKRSLGWVPFKGDNIRVKNDTITYLGNPFKIWKHRNIPVDSIVKCGNFNQDSQGRWFISIVVEVPDIISCSNLNDAIGIDLGIKEVITLSNADKHKRAGTIRKYEDALAGAQRARKKRRVKSINSKIKNTRKDIYHKMTHGIAKQFSVLFVGDVSSGAIFSKDIKPISKGVHDASWYTIRTLLEYKAKRLGRVFKTVNEKYTTQDCSSCKARSGPKGIEGLKIREWTCKVCNTSHDRDVNAAKNILRIGHDTLLKESRW